MARWWAGRRPGFPRGGGKSPGYSLTNFGARYDVHLTASEGGSQVEQRLSLHQRG